jgi:DNA integrity scanning protein DisA with diadenylate cyclase activity
MKDRIFCIVVICTLFLTGSLILFIFSGNPFLRGFVSDIIAVIFIYYVIRFFKRTNPLTLGTGILLFSFLIEFSQLFKITDILGLSNSLIRTLLGSTYDPLDFIAYLAGVAISVMVDISILKNEPAFSLRVKKEEGKLFREQS